MGIFRTAIIGAVIYGAYKYITKKDETGKSLVDEFKEKSPEWMDKARAFKRDMGEKFDDFRNEYVEAEPGS